MPILLSDNLLIALSSYAIAHGLQYFIFLVFYTLGISIENESKKFNAIPILIFIFILSVGVLITMNNALLERVLDPLSLFLRGNVQNNNAKIGFGVVLGLTLAHFWIDQYVWRLRESERREWFKNRFSIILPSS